MGITAHRRSSALENATWASPHEQCQQQAQSKASAIVVADGAMSVSYRTNVFSVGQ